MIMFACMYAYVYTTYVFIVLALSKTQWNTFPTGKHMIAVMVLLCCVNLSGMSLEFIVSS